MKKSNVIQLHPPMKQHHHTTSAMMDANLRAVQRRAAWCVFWCNFCWSMITVFAVVTLFGWVMS